MPRTLFTSRAHSYSQGEQENRRALGEQLRLELKFMNQLHGNQISIVTLDSHDTPDSDALITMTPGVGVAVMVADCLPILIGGGAVVAAVHAGRKGLITGVISATLDAMLTMADNSIENYSVQIGPSICSRCYEVSPQMYAEVIASHPAMATDVESHALDLQTEAVSQLLASGIPAQRIRDWGVCTLESAHHFSYRGGDLTARQIGVIAL